MRGHAPLVTGEPFQPTTGFEGAPFFGEGATGMMAQMFLEPMLRKTMGKYGMTPFGLHDQNIYDLQKRQDFTRQQQTALYEASEGERGNLMRTFRGVAGMTGTPWGGQQMQAAGALSDIGVTMAPFMAQIAPGLLDQMGGLRGSPTVMANQMIMGGRYRQDAVTGRMGMTGESAGAAAKMLFRDLYETGDPTAMQGITAGKAGEMFNALQRRGMIEGPADVDDLFGPGEQDLRRAPAAKGGARFGERSQRTMAALRDIGRARGDQALKDIGTEQGVAVTSMADLKGLDADDLDKLRLDPAVADRMRQVDTEGIKRSLKSYVGAIGAIRDIFGELGRTDAPMGELIQGLEAMSQGTGLSQMDPGRLGMMVRTTYNVARNAGIGMDQMMGIQQHGANRARQLGMEEYFGIPAAQGAVAFGQAYRASGQAAVPAWGLMDAEQLTQLDTNLRVQAAGSKLANRGAVAMRLHERVGKTGGYAADSEAAAYVEALQRGDADYVFKGEVKSVDVDQSDFNRMFTEGDAANAAGITTTGIQRMLGQREANRETLSRNEGIAQSARATQPRQARGFVAARFREDLVSTLMDQGLTNEEATDFANDAAASMTEQMFEMDNKDFRDPTRRNEVMGQQLSDMMAKDPALMAQLKRENPNLDIDAFAASASEGMYAQANKRIGTSQLRGYRNLQNIHAVHNTKTLRQGRRNRERAVFDAEMQTAMAPLGRGTPLQRGMAFLQNENNFAEGEDKEASLAEFIATTFGGVPQADIQKQLAAPLMEIEEKRDKLQALEDRIQDMPIDPPLSTDSPPERARKQKQVAARQTLQKERDSLRDEMRDQIEGLTRTAEDLGYDIRPETVTEEQAEKAVDTQIDRFEQQRAARAAIGLGGDEIDQGDIDREMVEVEGQDELTQEQAATVLREEQRATNRALADDPAVVARFREAEEKQGRGYKDDDAAKEEMRKRADIRADSAAFSREDIEEVQDQAWRVTGKITDEAVTAYIADAAAEDDPRTLSTEAARDEMAGKVLTDRALDETKEEFVRQRRRDISVTPDDDEIAAGEAEARNMLGPGATQEAVERQGRQIAHTELLRKKFGISDEDITGLGQKYVDAGTYIKKADGKFYDKATGHEIPKASLVGTLIRDKMALTGVDPVTGAYRQAVPLTKQEQRDRRKRAGAFWASNEGGRFRETIGAQRDAATDLSRAVMDDERQGARVGLRGIELAEQIESSHGELAGLAYQYAGGDLARLLAGDLDIDVTTDEGATRHAEVMKDVAGFQGQQFTAVSHLSQLQTATGAERERLLGTPKEQAEGLVDPVTNEDIRKLAAEKGIPESVAKTRLEAIRSAEVARLSGGLKTLATQTPETIDKVAAHFKASEKLVEAADALEVAGVKEGEAGDITSQDVEAFVTGDAGKRGRLERTMKREGRGAAWDQMVKKLTDDPTSPYTGLSQQGEAYKDSHARQRQRRKDLEDNYGIKGPDFQATVDVMGEIRDRQEQAQDKYQVSPQQQARTLYDTFGVQAAGGGKDATQLQQAIAGSPQGQAFVRAFATHGDVLEDAAIKHRQHLVAEKGKGDAQKAEHKEWVADRGSDDKAAGRWLSKEFRELDTEDDPKAEEAFFKKYGIDTPEAQKKFRRASGFYSATGADEKEEDFGGGDVLKAFRKTQEGSYTRYTDEREDEGEGKGGPGDKVSKISGTLNITGISKGDLKGTIGNLTDQYAGHV
jgi:hypothetical protein